MLRAKKNIMMTTNPNGAKRILVKFVFKNLRILGPEKSLSPFRYSVIVTAIIEEVMSIEDIARI